MLESIKTNKATETGSDFVLKDDIIQLKVESNSIAISSNSITLMKK